MVHKSLHLLMPSKRPFDKENWFESFVGNFVVPLIATGKIHQYWFSRYGSPDVKCVRFRFTLDDYTEVKPLVEELIVKCSLTDLKDEEDYDWVGDLGKKRFLDNNKRQSSRSERAQLVFNYLHSVACLFVDCLSYHDEDGYFYQEENTDYNNPHRSVFESLHHLFCNMTDVTTVVREYEVGGNQVFESELYSGYLENDWRQAGIKFSPRQAFKVRF